MEPLCQCDGRKIPQYTIREESPWQNETTQVQGRYRELPDGHGNPELQSMPSWYPVEDSAEGWTFRQSPISLVNHQTRTSKQYQICGKYSKGSTGNGKIPDATKEAVFEGYLYKP